MDETNNKYFKVNTEGLPDLKSQAKISQSQHKNSDHKEKVIHWTLLKLKPYFHHKDIINRVKRQTVKENI